MNLAKISANGQLTLPIEIRKLLGVKAGDKVLFIQNDEGEIVVSNASSTLSMNTPQDENPNELR